MTRYRTLQEAFLLQESVFLSNNARDSSFTFHHLISLYKSLKGIIDQDASGLYTKASEMLTASCSLMEGVGLSAIATGNCIAAIPASSQRITTREVDRIYGIQQIFGFRLGITLPGATPPTGSDFTREELELQFSQTLLASYPLLSQLHVFTSPVQFGYGWRLNSNSVPANSTDAIIPLDALDIFGQQTAQTRASCSMTTVDVDGVIWGQFNGLLYSLKKLATKAAELDASLRGEPLYGGDYSKISILEAHLDASDLLSGSPVCRGPADDPIPDGDRQRALVQWLSESFPANDLQVLLLGPELGDKRFGLILLRQEGSSGDVTTTRWRRLGYCEWWWNRQICPWQWYVNAEPPEKRCVFPRDLREADIIIFQGYPSDDWKQTAGYFG